MYLVFLQIGYDDLENESSWKKMKSKNRAEMKVQNFRRRTLAVCKNIDIIFSWYESAFGKMQS